MIKIDLLKIDHLIPRARLGKLVRARSVADIIALCDGYVDADEPGITVRARLVIQPVSMNSVGRQVVKKVL